MKYQTQGTYLIGLSVKEDDLRDIPKSMVVTRLCSSFPFLSTLLQIFICLPVSSACAERSFSRTKLTNLPSIIHGKISFDPLSLQTPSLCKNTEIDHDDVKAIVGLRRANGAEVKDEAPCKQGE